MLQITIDNCYKCNLETINDPNNSQYFWSNRQIQKLKLNVAGKLFLMSIKTYRLKKYRKELTPNIRFQPNKIFVRNELFEKII